MRVFLAGLWQETNTFCPHTTEIGLFESGYRLKGDQVIEKLAGTNTEVGGFLNRLEADGTVQVIPGTAAWATPHGRITEAALEELVSDLLASLVASLPVDGVLLTLHGSLSSNHIEDCEGHVIKRVRQVVGNEVPVVCSLDYHACITKQMVAEADLLVGYRTYPHIDYADTGRRAAAALLRLMRDRPELTTDLRKLPLMLPAENTETSSGPMASVIDRLWKLDEDPGIYAASAFCTQPWLDVTEHGASVLIYSSDGAGARPAQEIADYIWNVRQQFFLEFPDIRTYLDSIDQYARPAIIIDSGDLTSAGAVGDSTEILRALLNQELGLRAVLTMVDPSAVKQAVATGEGKIGLFTAGGSEDYGYNAMVGFQARVARISSSTVRVKGESFSGMELNMGTRARLDIDGGISLIVSERTSMLHDPEILRSMEVEPEDCDLIVQKSQKLFRAAYKDIAKSVQILDTPGFSDMNIKRLPFERVTRPIYPLDDV